MSDGVRKLGGLLVQSLPGDEAAALSSLDTVVTTALSQEGAVILVGERLATSPGALVGGRRAGRDDRCRACLDSAPRRRGGRDRRRRAAVARARLGC